MRRGPKVVLPIAVLLVASLAAAALIATRPQAEVTPSTSFAPPVRLVVVQPQSVKLSVTTHGTVAPRTESDLIPQVSGPVVEVAPALVSGGFFHEGDVLLRIDARDYEVALRRARAGVVRAESEHARAAKEGERIGKLRGRGAASASQADDTENAERIARAALDEARAMLEQAERDLERTTIRAPYTGRVRSESVGVGQFVNRGSTLAKLYATDYVEVRLPVPDDQLAYLDLPLWQAGADAAQPGPAVTLRAKFAGGEYEWRGRVVRTEGEIDPASRMVHVVARVEDPYGRATLESPVERPPLAVGLFVKAEIEGVELQDVIVLPRAAMRANDRVLVVEDGDRLRFREVDVVRADRERVIVRGGLRAGDRVGVSPLDAPVDGMQVSPVQPDSAPAGGAP